MDRHSVLKNKTIMIIAAIACCFAWGSAFPIIKLSYAKMGIHSEFEKILFAGLRFALAGFGVLAFVKLKQRKTVVLRPNEVPFMLLIALLQTFGKSILFYIGLSYTTGVKSSILVSTSVFIVAIMCHFCIGTDKLSWKKALGLLCGFSGVVLVNLSGGDAVSLSLSMNGEGLILISVVLGALTVVLIKKQGGRADIIRLTGWQMFLGGMALIAVGFAGSSHMPTFTVTTTILLLYLATLSGVAFTFWFVLLKYHNASSVELYKFVVPISGSLLSVILLPGEHIGVEMIAAAGLVAVGTIIVNRQDKINV